LPSLRLSEADRERLGAPELLPFDVNDVTNREAIEIARVGYKTPHLFRRALFAKNADDMDILAWTTAVWLALRRAGVDVDLVTFEFNVDQLDYIPDPEPASTVAAADEGKAPAPSTISAKPRSTRGATSKAKSGTRSPNS